MKITHVAIWTADLEKLKDFYLKYFGGKSNEMYINQKKGFSSYFISFSSGTKLELMNKLWISEEKNCTGKEYIGIAHLAFSVGSKEDVDSLTSFLKSEGYTVLGEPRTTGDGFYESLVLDPDKNRIEITV